MYLYLNGSVFQAEPPYLPFNIVTKHQHTRRRWFNYVANPSSSLSICFFIVVLNVQNQIQNFGNMFFQSYKI